MSATCDCEVYGFEHLDKEKRKYVLPELAWEGMKAVRESWCCRRRMRLDKRHEVIPVLLVGLANSTLLAWSDVVRWWV